MLLLYIIGTLVSLYIAAIIARVISSMLRHNFRGLKPLEKKLLNELRSHLEPAAQKILDEQLKEPLNGFRYYFDKGYTLELYINVHDSKRPMRPGFPLNSSATLATLTFHHKATQYKTSYKISGGALYNVNVRPNPKKILGRQDITFTKFKIVNDPMTRVEIPSQIEVYRPDEQLPGVLKDLNDIHALKNVHKPLSDRQLKHLQSVYGTAFPADYLDLIKLTNSFEIGNSIIQPFSGLESVANDSGDYLKLVDTPEGVLCVKSGSRTSKLTFLYFEDETTVDSMGTSFIDALKILARKYA